MCVGGGGGGGGGVEANCVFGIAGERRSPSSGFATISFPDSK